MKNTTMKIIAGIAGLVATGVGAAVFGAKKNIETTFIENLNDEIGSEKFKYDPLYGTVVADPEASLHTVIYKTVTPEFFEKELNRITKFMYITMSGDLAFNSYVHSLQDTGADVAYYYIKKSELDNFVNKITGDKIYNKFIITLGSKVLATNHGKYGDIITVSTEESMGDEYDLHFVNIYGKWKFISYTQLMKDTSAAMHFGDCGTSSSHRLLHGVQVVALRDDTKEV